MQQVVVKDPGPVLSDQFFGLEHIMYWIIPEHEVIM